MNKFKIGDKVTLRMDSEFYDPTGEDEFNPFGKVGVVDDINGAEPLNIFVDWQCTSTGSWEQQVANAYREKDLDLVSE